MAAIPTIQEAQAGYAEGTARRATTWESRAAGAAQVWEQAAKSPAAEQAYAQGVRLAADQGLRMKGLAGVTSSQFAGAVRGKSGKYQAGTAAATGKWAAKFSPYLETLRSVTPTIGARVPGDVSGNIDRRVKPIAQALHNQKVGGGGAPVAPAAGMPFGAAAPTLPF